MLRNGEQYDTVWHTDTGYLQSGAQRYWETQRGYLHEFIHKSPKRHHWLKEKKKKTFTNEIQSTESQIKKQQIREMMKAFFKNY